MSNVSHSFSDLAKVTALGLSSNKAKATPAQFNVEMTNVPKDSYAMLAKPSPQVLGYAHALHVIAK